MKRTLTTLGFAALLAGASLPGWTVPAYAGNSGIEATIQGYGDLSMFYQAMLNTGVINELQENQRYTVFAPVNSAFAEINPQNYPCFYAVECRPQIAVIMRNHVIPDRHSLNNLVAYGQGIQTMGGRRVFVQEPYATDYTVDGRTILSKTEVDGNIIYRIDGVIASPRELTPFQTVSYQVPQAVTTTTYSTQTSDPDSAAYPAGSMAYPDHVSEKTTIIHTITSEQ